MNTPPSMNITVVIPVYNREVFLDRALRSIPVQYPLIIVDNGSTDHSREVAERYCQERSQQTGAAPAMVLTETTPGAAAARNCGLAHCQTEWIYFFDSDDEFTALPALPTEPCDMLCFPVAMGREGHFSQRYIRPTSDPAWQILASNLITLTMIFRTEWLRSEIGGWNPDCRVWDDWELGLRSLLHHPRIVWRMERTCHRVHLHPDSLTGKDFSSRVANIVRTMTIAYADIQSLVADRPQEAARLLRAMDLRCHIYCGLMRREGGTEAAHSLRQLVQRPTLWGCFLETYTAHGGRGAWRLALKSLSSKLKTLSSKL